MRAAGLQCPVCVPQACVRGWNQLLLCSRTDWRELPVTVARVDECSRVSESESV